MASQDVEEELRVLLAAGDVRGAANLVMREHGPFVLRYLRSVLRDEDRVGDAYSDFAESMLRGLPGFRGDASARTWALRIALHASSHLRRDAWNQRGRRFATGEMSNLAEEMRTKTAVQVERQRSALDELRDELTVEEQSLLALRVDQGLPWEDIAQVHLEASGEPVSVPALWKRFERLKAKLATLARERGLLE